MKALATYLTALTVAIVPAAAGTWMISNSKGFSSNPVVDVSGTPLTGLNPVIVAVGTFASQPVAPISGSGAALEADQYAALLAEFSAFGPQVPLMTPGGPLNLRGVFDFQHDGAVLGTPLAGKPVYLIIAKGTTLAGATQVAILRTNATFDATEDENALPKRVGVGVSLGTTVIVGADLLRMASATNLDPTPDRAYSLAALVFHPDIAVEQPAGTTLTSGMSSVACATVALGSHIAKTFTIRNTGPGDLTLGAITTSGGNAGDFTPGSPASNTVVPGASTTFTVQFAPTTTGAKTAALHIASNMSGANNPFDINLTGAGATALAMYEAFVASHSTLSGPAAAPAAIPFNDGVKNLLKYAFNMNLAGPDSHTLTPGTGAAGLPVSKLTGTGAASELRIEYLRRKASGLIYTPEYTTDLTHFAPLAGTTTVTSIDSEWERVVVRRPGNPAIAPALFGRVEVMLP